jgi:hypothetical protein
MIHINKFIDKIKFFEGRNSKDFIIPLSEAKNLHTDITKLLIAVHEQGETKRDDSASTNSNVSVSGGDW